MTAISPVSFASVNQFPPANGEGFRQAFSRLTSALQSGGLSAAQNAYLTA